jgi:hypothetical protein
MKIASLEEQLDRLNRWKKRKAVPNPNRRFITHSEALEARRANTEHGGEPGHGSVQSDMEEFVASEESVQSAIEFTILSPSPHRTTRSGRAIKSPQNPLFLYRWNNFLRYSC